MQTSYVNQILIIYKQVLLCCLHLLWTAYEISCEQLHVSKSELVKDSKQIIKSGESDYCPEEISCEKKMTLFKVLL